MSGASAVPGRAPAWIALVAVAAAGLYAATFAGLSPIWTRVNAVAFADAAHYVNLLDDGHYRACVVGPPQPGHGEHERKTVHHILYLLLGEAAARTLAMLPGVDLRTGTWLISPILGGLNVLLAAAWFRRAIPASPMALAATLAFPLLPGTWVYASMPETWVLSTTAVLLVLNARVRRVPPALVGLGIGVLALTNFLILMTVLLVAADGPPLARLRTVTVAGVTAVAAWLGGLTLLGLLLAPEFFPTHFIAATLAFKARFPENLPLLHPGRWAYNTMNVLVLPFVLNQGDLNFGRQAILDTTRHLPLGTAAVAVLGATWLAALVSAARAIARDGLAATGRDALLDGELVYLGVAFLVTGVVLYYESFLYATMTTPLLLAVLARAAARLRPPAAVVWGAVAVLLLNAAQQIWTFRRLLGA